MAPKQEATNLSDIFPHDQCTVEGKKPQKLQHLTTTQPKQHQQQQ